MVQLRTAQTGSLKPDEFKLLMKNQGYAEIILRFFRSIILIDLSLAAGVGLINFILGWHTFEAYDMTLMWTGTAMIFVSCLVGMGGVAARLEDVAAFHHSGAGNMSENLWQISNAGRDSLGCFILLLIAGLGLLGVSYLLPILALAFG